MRAIIFGLVLTLALLPTRGWAQLPVLSDNTDSIAVVIGNKSYKRASTVDFAHNDAEAVKAYLTSTLGFREQNVLVLKDATQGELIQMFGSEADPQGGELWRSAVEGRSNVFVYYSGHGVPDLATAQPFLLPHDGNPNASGSGYALQTLYRNLELVRQKIGAQRQLIVMIDACFTGETGRKGESLLAVSAPGFAPAKPRTGNGIVKLVATSGATPANWDQRQKLGLFTSRFLMGAAGLARPASEPEDAPLAWSDLQQYLLQSVEPAARRDSGREQAPEIDLAPVALPVGPPVPAVARAVAQVKDEANWQRAKMAGERSALEAYIARCGDVCLYREAALTLLLTRQRASETKADDENWKRLSAAGRYDDYLRSCGAVCAYKAVANAYLGRPAEGGGPTVNEVPKVAARTPDTRSLSEPGTKAGAAPATQAPASPIKKPSPAKPNKQQAGAVPKAKKANTSCSNPNPLLGFRYDGSGRRVSCLSAGPASALVNTCYGRDRAGNRVSFAC
ncbi:caspase family protein [Bosea sp. (in: a-proteobacteria)]|jgi:hypothetical protein|uniref:caspase family protein n=1 Tax=Bosea sp. (in: a-proteobacteria) TaxID=1871050 RepID=UPI002DDD61EC|nr:caspase family protein [Bosea sp. (in: a-proteobacteria)]HEV2508622.1 caspase family protein [Bosea sp. (in: a-proteobacteria)]